MPAPERTTVDEILAAGRALLESGGVGALSMQAVADRVGVRAPSLYKRVRNRDELIRRVGEAIAADLGKRLEAVARDAGELPPGQRLAALARALRAFAAEQPAGYRLIFSPPSDEAAPGREALAAASAPLLRVAGELAGEAHALEAARTVTAWATGFLAMELGGAFRLGGDLDAAYEFGIERLATALAARP